MSIDVDGRNLGGPGHPWKFLTRPTSKAVPAEVCALPAEPTRPLQILARRKGRPLRQLTADSSSRRPPPLPLHVRPAAAAAVVSQPCDCWR